MARKYLTPIDLTGLELTNFKIQNLSNNPTAYGKGHTYFNTSENELRTYNGTEWVSVGGKIGYGNTASRPAAGHAGAAYADTQTGTFYVDNGTAWVQIGVNSNDVTTAIDALDTDAIEEGTTNLYFTTERAQDAIGSAIDAGTQTGASLSYIDGDNAINLSIDDQFPDHNTDDLNEGTTNLYFTDERAQDAIATAINNGGQTGILVEYDDASNAINFTVSSTPTFSTEIVFEGATADSNQTRLQVTDPSNNDNIITLPDASGTIALTSDITSAIDAIDTDAIEEGTTNLYYTDSRVDSHLSGTNGISYSSGTISANVGNGITTENINAVPHIVVDRTTVDAWYDASGAASTVQDNLDDHTGASSGVHGVTGDVVGTSDVQSLSNKTILGPLYIQSGGGAGGSNNTIDANNSTGVLEIDSGYGIKLSTGAGDIVLNPDNNAYVGSATTSNRIIVQSDLDALAAGLAWKQAVNLLYDDTTPTLTGDSVLTPLVIDGHTALGAAEAGVYRILVTGGNDAGIYLYNQSGTTWTLDRTADADVYTELLGAAVFVMEGDAYGSTSWVQANHYLTDFTGQVWNQFSGQGTYTAGDGLQLDGTAFSVKLDSDSLTKSGAGLKVNYHTDGGLDNDSGLYVKTGNGIEIDNSGNVAIDTAIVVSKYAQDITYVSGTPTSFNIDHNLGTRDCQVTVYSTSTYEEVIVDVTRTSTSRVVLDFAESPSSGAYRVVVQA